MVRILVYRRSDGSLREAAPPELAAVLADGDTFVWIDMEAPTEDEGRILEDPLGLHPVVVRACRQPSSSARVQPFDDYAFLTMHEVRGTEPAADETSDSPELDVVVARRWLLTHRDGPLDCVRKLRDALALSARPMARGPAFLLYELLDRLVEAYIPVIDAIDEQIEGLEDRVLVKPDRKDMEAILSLKRFLQRIRRASSRHMEILLSLSREESDVIPEEARIYFRSVRDHLARVADLAESYRDLLSGVLDAYLSTASNRLGQVMKVLTVISTLIMPMSCIASVYGMNFDTAHPLNMPELRSPYGYLMALGLMAAVGAGMLLYLRLRKWL